MSPPKAVHELIAPVLDLVGKKIRERGFTELEIEEALGWDPRRIRRLTLGLQRPCVDEVLSILGVIDVAPEAFFAELYGMPAGEGPQAEIAELSALADSLANLLVKNGWITASELARAVAARAGKDLLPEAAEETAETP